MKKLQNALSDQFGQLKEKVFWRADHLGIDLTKDGVVSNLLLISNGATDADGNENDLWEAASWPERIFAIAFSCAYQSDSGKNSDTELIDALCLGNWAIGFVDGLPGENSDQHVCVSCLIKQHSSNIGKSGARKRHEPMNKLQNWAIEKYKAGEWKSANEAAHKLKDSVINYGRTINAVLSDENAQRTIADWFRKAV